MSLEELGTPLQLIVFMSLLTILPFMFITVSYTHLRAHETVLDLVCRLLLEQKNHYDTIRSIRLYTELHTLHS